MKVAIIGAGFGGVAAAAALLEAGFDDVLLLEKADRIGVARHGRRIPPPHQHPECRGLLLIALRLLALTTI
ncbi:NAD(P)-binding protein [Actinoplanes sp. TBRC 11911]|uniref:FAD-dependent oxidoreductase n=1 Tax=Actinoplanes sp. TBRC 11911 TaxID=2729386 RepID=UPI00145F5328|nr:FAD-dependent oxidoreductase [Actinoplanes sp. TBRC 11911]NMO55291.1 NAD(P)-binding protein [Actinoplanes sp. TBRC 11911]